MCIKHRGILYSKFYNIYNYIYIYIYIYIYKTMAQDTLHPRMASKYCTLHENKLEFTYTIDTTNKPVHNREIA